MQCVDYNRLTHTFDLPNRAMDNALALGETPITLPYIMKRDVEVLKANYCTSEEAADKLPDLVTFYQQIFPTSMPIALTISTRLGGQFLAIYTRNVFPDMKVTRGTYRNNLGHMDFPGCFRCHDGSHTSEEGKTNTQDCNTCHQPLAMDEAWPAILKTLGIAERISNVQNNDRKYAVTLG